MTLYRLLLSIALPVLLLRLWIRRLRGRAGPGELAERLGRLVPPAGHGPLLWLHGASNGELASARALLAEVTLRRPGLRVLVTTNTATGRALAAGWAMPGLAVALAPLDARWALRRFLARAQPTALVVVENELWPNRLALCVARGIPVIAIGARLSAKSARAWGRLPGFARRVMDCLSLVSAQDAASEARFLALGVHPSRVGPLLNLKAAVIARPDPATLARLAPAFDRDRTLLAASTHEGEEAPVLAAFALMRAADPRWRLILAPRHPRRAPAIAREVAAAGLPLARRSQGEGPGDAAVYLADTMGEMPLWYALAGITFTGGSLVPKGGHTPFEPAAEGSAILHGPHVANAAEAYARLDAAGGAVEVADPAALAAAALRLADPAARAAQVAAAADALVDPAEAAARAMLAEAILAALDAAIPARAGRTA